MAWTPRTLADALNNIAELDIDIENNESSLIIKMNDYGDLPLAVLFTSQQIVIETYIGNDSNLLIVFYVQIMPDDFVMQLHRF